MKPKKNNNKINKRNWPMILIENIKSGMVHIETLLLIIMMIFALNHAGQVQKRRQNMSTDVLFTAENRNMCMSISLLM